jgi:hypothetical protein
MTKADRHAAFGLAKRAAIAGMVGAASMALSGCAGNSGFNLGALTADQPGETVVVAPPGGAPAAVGTKSKLAFVPVVGAPADVSSRLNGSVIAAMEKQSIPIAKTAGDPADYTVRGYVVAAPEKSATKVSYIWDVTDKNGQRAHRVTGEELVPGKSGQDPWSLLDQTVIDRIATSTSAKLAAWVPNAGPTTTVPVAANTKSTTATGINTNIAAVPQPVAATPPAQPASVAPEQPSDLVSGKVTQQAALPAGTFGAVVPAVIGAPGDGQALLTQAIQRQLSSNGVQLVENGGPTAYTVQGRVQMGPPANGKQAIKIEWQVFDPAGKKVGTVSQNNIVAQGSLDGTWGRTANDAAGAAAKGILRLLPQQGQKQG